MRERMNGYSQNRREDEARAAASSEIVRLMVLSAVVLAVFAGGVYWLRQQPADHGAMDAAASIEVKLIQPEPSSLAVASAIQQNELAGHSTDGQTSEAGDWWSAEETRPETDRELQTRANADFPSALPARRSRHDETSLFRQALERHIAQYQRYPDLARPRRLQGTVEVMFELRRDGHISGVWVTASSGEDVLDAEAIATLYRAEPLPPIPSQMPSELRIRLPINFALRERR